MTAATTAATTAAATTPFAAPILAPPQRVIAEYIYIGGSGTDLRSVTRVVELKTQGPGAVDVSSLPLIAVDGTGTQQASALSDQSALFLKPRSCWRDPLRGGGALLVLCEAYSPPPVDGTVGGRGGARGGGIQNRDDENLQESKSSRASLSPHPTNNRVYAERAERAAASEEPLFAISQQYLLCEGDGTPLGELPAGVVLMSFLN